MADENIKYTTAENAEELAKNASKTYVKKKEYNARQRQQDDAIRKNREDIQKLQEAQPSISREPGNQLDLKDDGWFAKQYDDTEIKAELNKKQALSSIMVVGSSNPASEARWYKFAETTIDNLVLNAAVISFKVTDTKANSTASVSDNILGIATINFVLGSTFTQILNATFQWEYASSTITLDDFVLAYKLDESQDQQRMIVSLWANLTKSYQAFSLLQLYADYRSVSNSTLWTLFNAPNYTLEIPQEYTQVPSTLMTLQNPVSGNSISGSQTESSSESGGKNVFSITFADGHTEDLIVYNGTRGEQGKTGAQGPKGDAGTDGAKGDKGDKGDAGAAGTAATITVGAVTTGAAGSSATVTNVGTTSAAKLNFTIPQGAKGDKGDTGATGAAGADGLTTSVTFAGTKYTQSGGNINITDAVVQKAVTPVAPTKTGQVAVYDGTSGKLKSGGTVGSVVLPIYFNAGVPTVCKVLEPGAFFNGVAIVKNDGVLEAGKYIDFHYTNDSTNDYDTRLMCNGNTKNVLTLPTRSGTLALLEDVAVDPKPTDISKTLIGTLPKAKEEITGTYTAGSNSSISDLGVITIEQFLGGGATSQVALYVGPIKAAIIDEWRQKRFTKLTYVMKQIYAHAVIMSFVSDLSDSIVYATFNTSSGGQTFELPLASIYSDLYIYIRSNCTGPAQSAITYTTTLSDWILVSE